MTEEMIQKAKNAKSAEELLTLAKENGIEMTPEEANARFVELHPRQGELSDDELDNVAGGCNVKGRDGKCDKWECKYCGGTNLRWEYAQEEYAYVHHCTGNTRRGDDCKNCCHKGTSACPYN